MVQLIQFLDSASTDLASFYTHMFCLQGRHFALSTQQLASCLWSTSQTLQLNSLKQLIKRFLSDKYNTGELFQKLEHSASISYPCQPKFTQFFEVLEVIFYDDIHQADRITQLIEKYIQKTDPFNLGHGTS